MPPGEMSLLSLPLARCWVLDRVDSWAVVTFIDFGQSATIPVQSLRSLDSDDFWTIPPLAQPFMLEKGKVPSTLLSTRRQEMLCAPLGPRREWRPGQLRPSGCLPFSLYSFDLTPVFSICPLQSCFLRTVFHTWSL